jgi:hypothetical protein
MRYQICPLNPADFVYTPFVAGVEYFSGLEPGWGYLLTLAMGRPLEISGFTTVTSPE